ncbi:MAG: homoserine kinase [Alphaproteobacteria bacterium]|nr:homoserine kinase [Alphaproteobacteria bacterium]
MAVYTEVSDEDLNDFIANYDLGDVVSCKGIAEGVENSNYLLQTTKGSYILTLYERRVKPADLPFFLALTEHLAQRGVKCPLPIHGRDGATLRTLCGRPAAVISFLSGLWPRKVAPRHCAELGKALAGLHLAGRDFKQRRANDLSVDGWRRLHGQIAAADAEKIQSGLHELIGAEIDDLAAQWPKALPEGVIHADLFPDNVFFMGETCSGLIDFYFACTDFLAYDIAVCLNAWCFEPNGAFNATKGQKLLGAYQAARPLAADEKVALPLLARGAAMRFLLTRLYDWVNTPAGALVKPKDPREYLKKLNFHRGISSAAAYGLA